MPGVRRKGSGVRLYPVPGLPQTKLPTLPSPAGFSLSKGPRGRTYKTIPKQPQEIPEAFRKRFPDATLIEYLTFWVLETNLHYVYQEDFHFQRAELGRYFKEFGSTVVDFLVTRDHPWLAMPVQGEYFHLMHGPTFFKDIDIMRRLQQVRHYDVIPLDETPLMNDAVFVVRQAVLYRQDLSRYRSIL